MTKRLRSSVFGLLFVSSIALPVSAGAAGFVVGAHGGVTVPSGDFGDFWDTGYLFGGYGEYLMSEAFALGVDVNYATNNPSDTYTDAFPGSDDSEFQYLNIGAHGKLTYLASGSPLRPYGVGGGGMRLGHRQRLAIRAAQLGGQAARLLSRRLRRRRLQHGDGHRHRQGDEPRAGHEQHPVPHNSTPSAASC